MLKVSLDEFRAMLTDPDPDIRWKARMLFLLPIHGHELDEVDRARREFRAGLADPDPVVRQRAEDVDRARLWGAPRENVQAVLDVLADDTAVEAWPGCVELLSAIAPDELRFDWLVTILARTSLDGLGDRLATALGLPGGRDLPRFTIEQAGEGTRVTCDSCPPLATGPEDGDDTSHAVPTAQCKRVSALVALLGSRHERVQQRAVQRLAELGPSVAGVLRTVCRSRTPSRRGAVAALAEIGWHELDPADRDLLARQPAHHLLPAAMRELPWPWNDLHDVPRSRKLKKLPHTPANERAALDALTAALSGLPSPLQDVSHGDSWEELFDRFYDNAWYQLRLAGRRYHLLTREAVTEVLRKWAQWADPPVPDWWVKGQSDQIAREWADIVFSEWARDLLWWLRQEPRDAERIVEVAERCIKNNLAVTNALSLLGSIGAPHGEQALLRAAWDDGLSEDHRAWAREQLIWLRRPRYTARGQEPAQGEEPLLPPAVQELPYGWDGWGSYFRLWPDDLPATGENIARARAILEACAPSGPVPEPVPRPNGRWDCDYDEESQIRPVMLQLMPHTRQVTRERMTEAMHECALLGIPGVPQDPHGEEARRFVRQWVTWISGWIADEVFRWLRGDDPTRITSWATELAEQYVRNGMGGEHAVWMLHEHHPVPRSREALARIAADDSARISSWAMEAAAANVRDGTSGEETVWMLHQHRTVPRSREALARIAADDSLSCEVRDLARDLLQVQP